MSIYCFLFVADSYYSVCCSGAEAITLLFKRMEDDCDRLMVMLVEYTDKMTKECIE